MSVITINCSLFYYKILMLKQLPVINGTVLDFNLYFFFFKQKHSA